MLRATRDAATTAGATYEGCLALERATDAKHERRNGEACAMSGATPRHARSIANAQGAIGFALRGKPCAACGSDLKVRVDATDLSTYPDVSVICGPLVASPRDRNAATNPTLLVEVLSPSTTDWDLGGKFLHYTRIPSLREVLYVWPDDRRIQLRSRNDDGSWTMRDLDPARDVVLASVDVTLARADLFARIDPATEA